MRSQTDFGWRRRGVRGLEFGPLRRLLAKEGQRRVLLAGGLLVLLLTLLLLGLAQRGNGVATPSAKPERGDVRITLTESGELRAAQQTTVSAANDKLIVWLVPEAASDPPNWMCTSGSGWTGFTNHL